MFGCFRVGRLLQKWWIVLYDRCGVLALRAVVEMQMGAGDDQKGQLPGLGNVIYFTH